MKTRIHAPELPFRSWGGRRAGAGRKRKKPASVPHAKRPPLSRHHPVHVTLKLRSSLPPLRRKREYEALLAAFDGGKQRFGFRLTQFSVLNNHLHLIVEAADRRSLTCALAGLVIRLAKALNRLWRRKGRVFRERFHEHVLKTPLEVRRALLYVLRNAFKHGALLPARTTPVSVDPFSSGRWFDGWSESSSAFVQKGADPPVASARTWLQRIGWRRHGLIRPAKLPSG